ncbi:MAG: ABC transporter permease [Tannerellaceae bacterium]|jgi:putative ABC transport system permease protein|nr:ABC transporter permease [Tannerellaceae bacterium]
MYLQYIKQALYSLRENPLVSLLTVLGTALSVAMIMVLVLIYQTQTAAYAPVSNRGRILYITEIKGEMINATPQWHSSLGSRVVRECFYPMQTPQKIAAAANAADQMRASSPGVKRVRDANVRAVDAAFWQVFDFRFLAGAPFTEEMFRSATPVVVVSEALARTFFGQTDAVGQTLSLDFVDYTIVGVVNNVSEAVQEVYAEAWTPYTLHREIMNKDGAEGICNRLCLYLLAESTSHFDDIRRECTQRLEAFNGGQKEWKATIWSQPLTSTQRMFYNTSESRMRGVFSGMLLLALMFFFLPVCNLLGIVFSQIRKRGPEIGIRKAFGATNRTIVAQILWENLFVTLLGGLTGLLLSFLFFYLTKDSLLERRDVTLQAGMMLQPFLFLTAIGVCLLINLAAAGIPARRMARTAITDSLNDYLE